MYCTQCDLMFFFRFDLQMGHTHSKKAMMGGGGQIHSYVPEISAEFFAIGREVLWLLQEAIQKFQGKNYIITNYFSTFDVS